MLKVFDEDYGFLPARENQTHLGSRLTGHDTLARKEDTECRKVFLPRGTLQAKCEPQPYYYFASNSGAVPTWVIDEITQGHNRSHRPE